MDIKTRIKPEVYFIFSHMTLYYISEKVHG